MLEHIDAVDFYKVMGNGRTAPLLLRAETAEGRALDVVAKFLGPHLPPSGLVREAIGAMLAAELGIPTPEPFVVHASEAFIESIRVVNPVVATRLSDSSGLGYASRHLTEGFQTWPSKRQPEGEALTQAAEILAFDCWFQNPDRKPSNPNLLWNGTEFAVIDHELAFVTEGVLFWKPPWLENAVDDLVREHLFGTSLRRTTPDLARIVRALKSISDERLLGYIEALPQKWVEDLGPATNAVQFIKDVRDNADAAAQEVLRALQ